MYRKEYIREYKTRLKAEHRCRKCGRPLPIGYALMTCEICRNKLKVWRAGMREGHRCTQCGNALPEGWLFESCNICRDKAKNWVINNRDIKNAAERKWNIALRQEVLKAYGNKCVCCGEAEEGFLTIDHIENDGAEHRKNIGEGSGRLYRWLKANQFPVGFQILCANCHLSKSRSGVCLHQRKEEYTTWK